MVIKPQTLQSCQHNHALGVDLAYAHQRQHHKIVVDSQCMVQDGTGQQSENNENTANGSECPAHRKQRWTQIRVVWVWSACHTISVESEKLNNKWTIETSGAME